MAVIIIISFKCVIISSNALPRCTLYTLLYYSAWVKCTILLHVINIQFPVLEQTRICHDVLVPLTLLQILTNPSLWPIPSHSLHLTLDFLLTSAGNSWHKAGYTLHEVPTQRHKHTHLLFPPNHTLRKVWEPQNACLRTVGGKQSTYKNDITQTGGGIWTPNPRVA